MYDDHNQQQHNCNYNNNSGNNSSINDSDHDRYHNTSRLSFSRSINSHNGNHHNNSRDRSKSPSHDDSKSQSRSRSRSRSRSVSSLFHLDNVAIGRKNSENCNRKKSIRLDRILSNYYCFDMFMKHLVSEFAIECLLSVTEIIQFKKFVKILFDLNLDAPLKKHFFGLKLSDKIPLSEIVYDETEFDEIEINSDETMEKSVNDTSNSSHTTYSHSISNTLRNKTDAEKVLICKTKAWKLYEKYIRIGSEFEVNISDNDRRVLINKMQNKNKWLSSNDDNNNNNNYSNGQDLFILFDKACQENVRLLTFLLLRMVGHAEKKDKLFLALNSKQMDKGPKD